MWKRSCHHNSKDSHVHIKVYKSLSCSPSRRLQSPSASNESYSTPSLGRDSSPLGASPSQSAVTLSPTKDETAFALSPTAKDSASAVLQESNHTSELQYSSLLSEKPKLLIPTPEFFPKGDGARSKRECNTKTKLVAKLMRQNSKRLLYHVNQQLKLKATFLWLKMKSNTGYQG